ncbi:hypothetical protein FALBO_16158 [Fusarium albosuccineum]|uniref:Uncharacterized protein n=1 Tax=Fusarium albosuccineum TaxID=1237068 RepID=A0A8H4KMU2_9HYPO|nr:hypothetical protein FALBO_16158 [Fusarium albosuccineum]
MGATRADLMPSAPSSAPTIRQETTRTKPEKAKSAGSIARETNWALLQGVFGPGRKTNGLRGVATAPPRDYRDAQEDKTGATTGTVAERHGKTWGAKGGSQGGRPKVRVAYASEHEMRPWQAKQLGLWVLDQVISCRAKLDRRTSADDPEQGRPVRPPSSCRSMKRGAHERGCSQLACLRDLSVGGDEANDLMMGSGVEANGRCT